MKQSTGRRRPGRRVRLSVLAVSVLLGVVLVPQALAETTTLFPVADTFVQAGQPGVAYGAGLGAFDVYGGTNNFPCPTVNGDPCTPGPAYGLLRFDLGSIPAGSTVTGVQLKLGQTKGFAEDGDQAHHVIFIDDDGWTRAVRPGTRVRTMEFSQ